MKKLKPLLFLCLLSVFAACKKDTATPQPSTPQQEEIAVTDSGSYTVNGKTYVVNSFGNFSVSNTDASLKIDSVVDHVNYYISGNKDSVFFARTYGISNYKDEGYMEISFFKKYSKLLILVVFTLQIQGESRNSPDFELDCNKLPGVCFKNGLHHHSQNEMPNFLYFENF